MQIWRLSPWPVDLKSIAERLVSLGRVAYNEHLLRAEIGRFEIALFRDGRGIIRGTKDLEEARILYSRFTGAGPICLALFKKKGNLEYRQ